MGNLAIKMRQWKKREEFNKEKGLNEGLDGEVGMTLSVQDLGRRAGDWREWQEVWLERMTEAVSRRTL